MVHGRLMLLGAALTVLAVTGAGCNCGGPPTAEDAGTGGGGGGGAFGGGGGGAFGGGGGAFGGGGGATGGPVIEFSAAAGHVSGSSGLSAEVQVGVVPARQRASGGALVLEGSAVLLP
jgi:hypothetical protein